MVAAVSGSGSAVFGLSRGRAAAERAVKPLSRNGAKALVTRTLTRAEHERRARAVARRA
jgi:4-diphosphocytidyl-2C-methyl-D-erythritol kinase